MKAKIKKNGDKINIELSPTGKSYIRSGNGEGTHL
jgi:hypothetical protein